MRKENEVCLQRNDQTILRQVCSVKPYYRFRIDSLCKHLRIAPFTTLLRSRQLRWFENVICSNNWIKQCLKLDFIVKRGKGQPQKTWDDVIQDDLKS